MQNEMNNMNEYQFEDMRQQMNTLKKKLEQQEIINDRVIRQSMRKSANSINRRYTICSILCLVMIPYGYWAFVVLNGSSIGVWITLSVLMLITFGYSIYNGRHLRDKNLFGKDLIGVRQKMAKAKKLDSNWLMFGIPAATIWVGYFLYDKYVQMSNYDFKFFAGLMLVSAVIGGLAGLKIHYRNQDNYQEIIDQIEELTEDKE